jgi:hypothetical protein
MRLDAKSPYIWRQINQLIKEKLGLQANVFLYRGLHQAVFETLLGLHLRFSHKRKVVVQSGFGDHFKQAEVELAKMGVRFKSEFEEDMAKEEKACLAYVHDLDDALTAEIYDHIETLKQVATSKTYRIHVAHHLFGMRQSFVKNLTEFDIIIASVTKDYALVFTGEKINLPLLSVTQLPWSLEEDAVSVLKALADTKSMYQPEISQFESALPEGVRPWFRTQQAKRIYDRAVVVMNEHDGEAMMKLMNNALQIEKSPLGADNPIETLSPARWQNELWLKQGEAFEKTPDQIQGTMIFDGKILNTAFSQVFKDCLNKLAILSQ